MVQLRTLYLGPEGMSARKLEGDPLDSGYSFVADFQRRRVASALLRFLITRGMKDGRKRLFSEVSITARPVFERHGFKVLAYQTVETNGQTLGNYRMERLL